MSEHADLVLRCCRDWPVDWVHLSRDLCPVCGMRRTLVDLRRDGNDSTSR